MQLKLRNCRRLAPAAVRPPPAAASSHGVPLATPRAQARCLIARCSPLTRGTAPCSAPQQHNQQQQREQPARAAASPSGTAESSFVTDLERRTLGPEQLEFLERKRRAALGLGPIMPPSTTCGRCGGSGFAMCHCCGGSGMNETDKAEAMFRNERNLIIQNNGRVDMQARGEGGGLPMLLPALALLAAHRGTAAPCCSTLRTARPSTQPSRLQWFFKANCPCWLCRGKTTIGCPDCGGSGMTGMADFVAD